MGLGRMLLRCLVLTVLLHVLAVHCNAHPPTGTPLSGCTYPLNNLYVVNTIEPSTVFPTGYVSCANATGSDIELCKICSCRENKVGSAAGVTVIGAVCVGSGDATVCVGHEQEYCSCDESAGCTVGAASVRDGSEAMSDGTVVEATDRVRATNAENNSTSRPSLSSNVTPEAAIDNTLLPIDNRSNSSDANLNLGIDIDTAMPVIAPGFVNASIDTDSGSSNADSSHSESGDSSSDGRHPSSDSNIADINANIHSSIDTDNMLKPASPSIGYGSKMTKSVVENDNVASEVVGTVKPSHTSAALVREQDISSHENESTLGTTSGSAKSSSWSGERLTTVLSVICGTGVVAAIVVVVVMRRGQSKKDTELGTPTDDYANDSISIVTPTNSGGHGARYYSGENRPADSFEHTPLDAIAVIGFDDAFLSSPTSVSKHEYRSYSGNERSAVEDTCARTDSHVADKDVVMRDSRSSSAAIQPQFRVSNDPSVSVLLSPASIAMFDTSYSRESFSSDMSSPSESPSDELFRESKVSFDSFRVTCETSRDTDHDLDSLVISRSRPTSSDFESAANAARASVSSRDSVQYSFRDTEASEHMRESEMNTESSRIAISFDMDSYGSEDL